MSRLGFFFLPNLWFQNDNALAFQPEVPKIQLDEIPSQGHV
jgi:hypothetical protein